MLQLVKRQLVTRKILIGFLWMVPGLLLAASTEQNIQATLKKIMPQATFENIMPAPVPGLYQVTIGAQVLYVTADAQYIIEGDIYRREADDSVVNLTGEVRQQFVQKSIATLSAQDMIVFKAPQEKTFITVFTDIDCGYCRALHKEVPALNAAGITVRYLAFPRTDAGTPSYQKAESVWCAADKSQAYAHAIAGKEPKPATCKNPVAAQKALGESLGINVTPVVIFANGNVMPGYLPAENLIAASLEQR